MNEQSSNISTKSHNSSDFSENKDHDKESSLDKTFSSKETLKSQIKISFNSLSNFPNLFFYFAENIYCNLYIYQNSFIKKILSINQYFPEYEALFKYLNYCLLMNEKQSNISFQNQNASPTDSTLNQSKNSSMYINLKSNLFPIFQRSIVFVPNGHGLRDFFAIFSKLYNCLVIYLDLFIPNDSNISKLKQPLSRVISSYLQDLDSGKAIFSIFIHTSSEISLHSTLQTDVNLVLYNILTDLGASSKLLSFPLIIILNEGIDQRLPNQYFDFIFHFNSPSFKTRVQFLKVLPSLIPKNSINLEHLAQQMNKWNFSHIQEFYKLCQKYFIIENSFSKKKWESAEITTEYVLNLMNRRIFQPSLINNVKYSKDSFNNRQISNFKENVNNVEALTNRKLSNYNRDFIYQLYQEVASSCYDEMILILDKLQKGIILQKSELSLLADYSFLMKESPKEAITQLHKAKQRLSQIDLFSQKK
ncbi:hypothetical protein [Candidatus Harpocratesius sp.]